MTRVPPLDVGWEHAVLRTIENNSITSGGSANLLIPIDEVGGFHPAFWPLIELFDADIWNWYVSTRRGQQMANPIEFEEGLQREAEEWAAEHGGSVEDAKRMFTRPDLMTHPQSPWPPPKHLAEAIMRRTAPGFTRGGTLFGSSRADDEPNHHMVDVATLNALPGVMVADVSSLPVHLQVLAVARLGSLNPAALGRLHLRGVAVDVAEVNLEDVRALMRFELQAASGGTFGPGSESRFLTPGAFDATPASLSTFGWTPARFAARYSEDGPLVLVVGDTVNDFCFAHALERCGVQARWLPHAESLPPDPHELAATAAFALGRFAGSDDGRDRVLTSLSLTVDSLEGVRAALTASHWLNQTDLLIVAPIHVPLPDRRLPTLLDPEVFNEPLEEPFLGDGMARPVSSAYPSKITSSNPNRFTWWVDIEDANRPLPARSSLNELVVASNSGFGQQVRCGRDAISFYSHHLGIVLAGSPLSQLVERPRLRFPNAAPCSPRCSNLRGTAPTSPQRTRG